MTLFCPQGHLLLRRENDRLTVLSHCPQCGWQASGGDEAGKILWQVDLKAPLAGPTRRMVARPAAHRGLLFLPLANGELVALRLSDGQQVWRTTMGAAHLLARTLAVAADRLLALVLDARSLGTDYTLVEVDPATGARQPIFTSQGQLVGLEPFGSGVLSRSPEGVFYLVPSGSSWNVVWQAEVPFSIVPPVGLAEQQVWALTYDLRAETGACMALDARDGRRLWEIPLPPALARAHAGLRAAPIPGGAVWSGERARGIWAVDAASGATRWLWESRRVYTPPVFDGKTVWAVVRGAAPLGAPGHYLLVGLEPTEGKPVAEYPLERRVLARPLVAGQAVVLADEAGFALAVDTTSGEILWEVRIGQEDEPPGMAPLHVPGRIVAGSFYGRLAMVSMGRPPYEEMAPQERLAAGDVEAAALIYALQGNLPQAANLYVERLHRPRQAVALLAFDGRLQEALQLAQEHALWDEAERLAAQAGDLPAEAEAREQRGDILGAARLWEQYGRHENNRDALERAADLFQQAGSEDESWRLRKELGQVGFLKSLLRLRPSVKDLEWFAEKEGLLEAGWLAHERGLYDRAAEFFRRAAEVAQAQRDYEKAQEAWRLERQALKEYLDKAGEKETPWAWERIAQISRRLGDFAAEAKAWEALGEDEFGQAAEAYYRAALQLEEKTKGDPALSRKASRQMAHFYEQFLRLHGLEGQRLFAPIEGMDKRIVHARNRWLALRRLPWVVVQTIRQDKAFREERFSTLTVRVTNLGYGAAMKVKLYVGEGGRFEVEADTQHGEVRLLANEGQDFVFFVKPLSGQAGEAVPLRIRWRWQDRFGHGYGYERSFPVTVHGRTEGSTSASRPTVIHADTVVMGDGARVYREATHVEGGTYVQGDQLAAGAQKGDRVEIRRGVAAEPSPPRRGGDAVHIGPQGIQMYTGAEETAPAPSQKSQRSCPVCTLTIPDDVSVCPHCGNPIASSESE